MRVLMICAEKLPVPPVLGGAIQTYIAGVLPPLSKVHQITVLGVNDPSLPDRETIGGVHYVRVPGKALEVYRNEIVRFLKKNHTFDLIHVFNRPRLIAAIRQAAPRAIITLSMHNDMFQPEKIDPKEAARAIKEVSAIVTVSDYIGNAIRQLYPQASSKMKTIYSAVDCNRFLPGDDPKMQKERKRLRKKHRLENKKVLLYAGRISSKKGVDRLIRAIPHVAQKHKDLALVIVGGSWFSQNKVTDYVAYARSLAAKLPIPVVMTGFVSPSEIQKWYAAADLFVCASIWQEPLARIHYEAMAAGLPIVTTARGGNPEVIEPGKNGLIVKKPEDPREFADKINELLSNPSMMKKLGKRGRKLAVSKYRFDRLAAELLQVWDRQLKNERRV